MKIVEAEPQLVADMLDEMEVVTSREQGRYKVYAGHHPTLGRLVVIAVPGEQGTIVEME